MHRYPNLIFRYDGQDANTVNGKPQFSFGEKPELDDYDNLVEREILKLNGNSYEDKCAFIEEWFQIHDDDNQFDSTIEETKREQEDNCIKYMMRVSLLQLKKHHQLFLNLGFDTCKEMITQMPLIILEDSQLLYKEGEDVASAYIVVLGKLILHNKKLGAIGLVKIGDMIGEEWLIKNSKIKERQESAYSSGLTFVLELTQEFWDKLRNILYCLDARSDYHKLMRVIETCNVKKKSWRQFKKRK